MNYRIRTDNSFKRISAKMSPYSYSHADVYRAVIDDMAKRGCNPLVWGGFNDHIRCKLAKYGYSD